MHAILKVPVGYALSEQALLDSIKGAVDPNAEIHIEPTSNSPEDLIYLGIWRLISDTQIEMFVDDPDLYPSKIVDLRRKLLTQLGDILSEVIVDNEHKVS